MEEMVRSGLVMAWRFATWPTRRSPVLENATTDGVVRAPSALADNDGLAALHDSYAAVGCAKVDSDDFRHDTYSS